MADHNLTAEQIADDLNRMGGWPKKTPRKSKGFMGLCPNHADKNPSLSVRQTQDGKILLHCFAPSCTNKRDVYESVEKALGMDPGGLNGPGDKYKAPEGAPIVKNTRMSFIPIVPVPDDAPKFSIRSRRFRSADHGQPIKAWVYKNAEGKPMGYVARYESKREDGSIDKMIWPWTFAVREGRREWVVGAMPEPRTLYNLDKIAANPDLPIQLHEGEKAADAGGKIFPNWIPSTTVGGGSSAHMTDLEPLRDRTVIMCMDMDQPGVEFLMLVVPLLRKVNAKVYIMRFPTSHSVKGGKLVPEPYIMEPGDDMADHLERGWTTDLLREVLAESDYPLTWVLDDDWAGEMGSEAD